MAGITQYTDEMATKICEAISSEAIGLKHICLREGFPAQSTVYKWLAENKEFSERYARAREVQADILADEIIDIADDGTNDYMTIVKGDQTYNVENREVTSRSKLRVDARKWKAAKLAPKKYGDRIQQDIEMKGELKTVVTGIDPPEGE